MMQRVAHWGKDVAHLTEYIDSCTKVVAASECFPFAEVMEAYITVLKKTSTTQEVKSSITKSIRTYSYRGRWIHLFR